MIVVFTRGVSYTRTRGIPSTCARKDPYKYTCRFTRMDMCMCVCGYFFRQSLEKLLKDSLEPLETH